MAAPFHSHGPHVKAVEITSMFGKQREGGQFVPNPPGICSRSNEAALNDPLWFFRSSPSISLVRSVDGTGPYGASPLV
ncbi:hypothetical protein BDV32DRAFT_143581 [Aspergillus pseudonomiae]|uniref:Uncharacterized protein n=1 Tax=Aspergillus pseudonomiae TaxID=1506151 RepID=A0A5N6HGH9_9EURO|nr:uncharacterized protein BDV37DRAFT_277276 [Aspergillus pseudonomiae]KAB8253631.1 hypothetical protein BDV32DRAFT_143581 [Aspergillus pseudonomiae]KAE8396971.1 hypothetical protein BDV37DRAFT_277276 [Aspergillus pseudonomiae]